MKAETSQIFLRSNKSLNVIILLLTSTTARQHYDEIIWMKCTKLVLCTLWNQFSVCFYSDGIFPLRVFLLSLARKCGGKSWRIS